MGGALREAARRQSEVLTRFKDALKDKRLVIIVGAGVTLNTTADESGNPLARITWTSLVRNRLDYLVTDGYVDAANRRTRLAYTALEDHDMDSLLDAASIMSSQGLGLQRRTVTEPKFEPQRA